ncbi:AI-2E family transporter [Lutispora thermophila]|uniref:Sporulation integral membrane protein YtvI n=1 Tax=Lutispora thermophila DSM 19022 TaxID=1122184 RepID=A0A1M6F1V2_9FIRM|nr:AI-2E family transporter [Lutispora thermophila]SHI91650.1 sporulation integral membrane protein YtvI [Lutispora thermophila DSM 19022]
MIDNIKDRILLYKLIKYVVIILLLLFLVKNRQFLSEIVSPFIISALLAYLLNPIVHYFEKRGFKRIYSVVLVYAFFLCLAIIFGLVIIPRLFKDVSVLVENIPNYMKQYDNLYQKFQNGFINSNLPQGIKDIIDDNIMLLQNMILSFLHKVADSIINFFSQLFNFIIVPVLTFYMLKDSAYFKNQLILILPKSKRNKIMQLFRDIDNVFGKYIRGQIFVCSVVGILTTIALLVIKVKYSLTLGMFASVSNIIPYFGPIIGMIPTVILALLDSPTKAFYAAGAYILVQQLESGIITPKIIGESVGIHPVYVIMALLIGGRILGIIGMLIAVPFAAVIKLCLRHFLKNYL